MLAAAIIVASLALIIAVVTLIIAGATYTKVSSFGDEQWEDSAALDAIYRQLKQLFRFVKDEYQRAASANGMFREQAAEARTKLSEHLAECHADEPKAEDTPAFTKLINEEATHKVADLFEALGVSPDEIAAATDTIQGEVTQILNGHGVTVYHNEGATFDDHGEITSLLGIPVVAESGPEEIYPDEELPFEDQEDDSCPRDEHRYNGSIFCTECGADGIAAGDIDPDEDDEDEFTVEHPTRGYEDVELPSEDQPMSQEYEEAVWPGHTERTTL